MKQALNLLCVCFAIVLCADTALAQSYPYPSMFEANDSWRGRIRYHRGPFGGERYHRRWGNGITDDGVALGTSFFGNVTSILTNQDFLEFLKKGIVGLNTQAQEAPEPEAFDQAITDMVDGIKSNNETLLKDLNEVRALFKDQGVVDLKFESPKVETGGENSNDPQINDPRNDKTPNAAAMKTRSPSTPKSAASTKKTP